MIPNDFIQTLLDRVDIVEVVDRHVPLKKAGANWVACASDELQDHHDREADIVARGRSAPGGVYKRLCTSTFKDSTEWRNFRDTASKAPDWRVVKLLGLDSPFVWPRHWERFKSNGITLREYQRRVLAMDVGPEAQLYHCWARSVDAAATFVKVLDLLAFHGHSLSQVVADLPKTHVVHETVVTPWEQKGTVMRTLVELAKDREVELVDGVKVIHESGWAMALPDPEEPITHIWAEGADHNAARALAQEYVRRIRQTLR